MILSIKECGITQKYKIHLRPCGPFEIDAVTDTVV